MNNIITIAREFGSGGRELAKRLAENLGYKYYDKEIISRIAKNCSIDEKYIEVVKRNSNDDYPYTISRSFSLYSASQKMATEILLAERKVIKEIAKQGNCVIVGRGADIILSEYKPLNIFVYADTESKLKRCKEKAPKNENLSDKELLRKIKQIDKSRRKHYLLLGNDCWGAKENYQLCVNTSNIEIKKIIQILSEFTNVWFKERK